MGLALALGFAIGGWWYCRNLVIGMPLTGWQESVPLSRVAVAAVALFHHGGWVNDAYTIAKSFTWFYAWSCITLRTWMYLVLEGVAFARMIASFRRQGLRVPLTFTIAFHDRNYRRCGGLFTRSTTWSASRAGICGRRAARWRC